MPRCSHWPSQGTQQYEAALAKPVGKLVNIAGRQRMLSQRMAKYYLATTLPVDAATAGLEINKARGEFTAAMVLLKNAPEATERIKNELALADAQWVFFDSAAKQPAGRRPTPPPHGRRVSGQREPAQRDGPGDRPVRRRQGLMPYKFML